MNAENEVNADSSDSEHSIAKSSGNSSSASNAPGDENRNQFVPQAAIEENIAFPNNVKTVRRLFTAFDIHNPQVPPGMTTRKALGVSDRISEIYNNWNVCFPLLLELPAAQMKTCARDMWAIALYNVSATGAVFHIFVVLAYESYEWAKVMLETICFLQPQQKFTDTPLYVIITRIAQVPPDINQNRAIGFIYLLNYMQEDRDFMFKVLRWLHLDIFSKNFRKMFVDTLIIFKFHNENYYSLIRTIIFNLARNKKWSIHIF